MKIRRLVPGDEDVVIALAERTPLRYAATMLAIRTTATTTRSRARPSVAGSRAA